MIFCLPSRLIWEDMSVLETQWWYYANSLTKPPKFFEDSQTLQYIPIVQMMPVPLTTGGTVSISKPHENSR